jgi:polysaccharide biosynthesis transport protein
MSTAAPPADQQDASIDVGLIVGAVMKRGVRIGLVTLILCAVAFAVLLFVPRLYESSAALLIEPRSNAFTRATNDVSAAAIVDEATVASQIELIKSRDTIAAVIENTGLREVPEFAGGGGGLLSLIGLGGSNAPSEGKIITAVNDNLTVAQERNSRLISIAFRSEDPQLAARVANAFAVVHVNRRAGQQISDTVEATAWLEQEIEGLSIRVAEAERRVADFRVQNDLFMGANNTSIADQQLSNFTSQIAAAAERRSAAETRAQLIRSLLESSQSVSGVTEVQASPVVQQLSQELARLQGERAQRSATLLSNHPTIRALDAQIGELGAQIAAEGRRVAEALERQAQIEADLVRSLEGELTRAKITAGSATREGVTLAELEREAAAQRDLLNAYLIRFSEATARTDANSALPDVRIVTQAAPTVTPVSPKTALTCGLLPGCSHCLPSTTSMP